MEEINLDGGSLTVEKIKSPRFSSDQSKSKSGAVPLDDLHLLANNDGAVADPAEVRMDPEVGKQSEISLTNEIKSDEPSQTPLAKKESLFDFKPLKKPEPIETNIPTSRETSAPSPPRQVTQDLPQLDEITLNLNPIADEKKEPEVPKLDPKEEQRSKQDLLFKLHRMEKRGVPLSQKFSMSNSKEEIEEEFNRLKSQRDLENSIRFQRKTLMAFVSGIEFLNSKFDPFDAKLDGWSETIHENIHDYDDVFEELHEKYKSKGKIAPELKLMMMVGGSATMYHMTNSIFRTAAPDVNQIFRENPDLAQQFGQATMQSMANNNPEMQGFANFMGSATAPAPAPRAARPEMRGPSTNADEILSKINSIEGNNADNDDMPVDLNQVVSIEEILDANDESNDDIKEIKGAVGAPTGTAKAKPSRRKRNTPNSSNGLTLDLA